jgi:hypothetical protein
MEKKWVILDVVKDPELPARPALSGISSGNPYSRKPYCFTAAVGTCAEVTPCVPGG